MSDTIFTATQGGRDKKWGGGGLEGEMCSLGFLKDRGYKVVSVCHGHDVAAEAEARTGLQDEQAGTEMQSASGVGGWGWGCQKEGAGTPASAEEVTVHTAHMWQAVNLSLGQ